MSPVCKMADNRRLAVDQKVKVVLFYAETKSVVATQRCFARGCKAKRWSHWTCSSLGIISQPMRINSVPDVRCFCNNKNVLCVQSMVWHFMRHPVFVGNKNVLRRSGVKHVLYVFSVSLLFGLIKRGMLHTPFQILYVTSLNIPILPSDNWRNIFWCSYLSTRLHGGVQEAHSHNIHFLYNIKSQV